MPQAVPVRMVSRGLPQLWRGRAALLVGLALSLGYVTGSQAATTWTVCASGCDHASIKAAIAASTTLDGDTIAIAAGEYTEFGITVNKSLTVRGDDAATTIVQADVAPDTASDRVFIITAGVSVTLQGLTIRHGNATGSGGGIFNHGTLTLTASTVRGNIASASGITVGGGIFNEGMLTLIRSRVRDNEVYCCDSRGGGLFNRGTLLLIHSTVSGNRVGGCCVSGGGIFNEGTMTLSSSTVRANVASGGGDNEGGGMVNNGTLLLLHSTVSGNRVTGSGLNSGGGLFNQGTLTLINATISGNTAGEANSYSDGEGGGILNYGTLTLTNSTVSGNAAYSLSYSSGGGVFTYQAPTLQNSIVANNMSGGDCRIFGSGAIISNGYNLDSDRSCNLTAPTDRPGTDPLLGPLQDNGGPTVTHALLPGSPALDAIPWGTNGCGTALFSDQRWQARPQPVGGPCDIGAYEVAVAGQPLGAWVTGLTPDTALCENATTGQAVTLQAPASPWDCEAAGLVVTSGDQVVLRVQGPVQQGATDVGGAVTGMAPTSGGCLNRTTGQEAPFEALFQGQRGATAASCGAAGLVVQPGDEVQLRVRGAAE